jgi:hypothetical protein
MTFAQFVAKLAPLFNLVLSVLGLIALLLFMIGLTRFLWKDAGSPEARQKGQSLILWGIIALFVLFAFGGILNFFAIDIFGTTVWKPGSSQESTKCIPTANGIGCAM